MVKLLPLVKQMAHRIHKRLPSLIEVDDLVSAGVLGLVDAMRKFDPRTRVKLETYARHRVRGAILDALRELDSASRDMRDKNKRAELTYRTLEARLGRTPSTEEMADALGVSLKKWFRMAWKLRAVGMDWFRPIGQVGKNGSKPSSEETPVPDNQNHPYDLCYCREQREILQRAMAHLPERQRQIVQLYYDQAHTMKEIGKKLGVHESRVSQLHSSALVSLRSHVRQMLNNPSLCAPGRKRNVDGRDAGHAAGVALGIHCHRVAGLNGRLFL